MTETPDHPAPGSSASDTRPVAATIIAAILFLEALGLFAAAGWYLYGLLNSTPTSLGGAIFTMVFLLVLALWLLVVCYKLAGGYRWTRSAALVFQLFVVVIAVPTLSAGIISVGLTLLVPAAAVLLLLFTKPVVAYTSRTSDSARIL